MSVTILVTSSDKTLSPMVLRDQIEQQLTRDTIYQIFFLGAGISHANHPLFIEWLSQLQHHQTTAIALGYCPSSVARYQPDFVCDLLQPYGLTEFYVGLHHSTSLEQY